MTHATDATDLGSGAKKTTATWNLKCTSSAERTLDYLQNARWDVACLQEVNGTASELLEQQDDWTVVDGLQLARSELDLLFERPHAAAIVARNGWRLEDGGVMPDTPTPGRGVKALARRGEDVLSIVSWHAPNAVPNPGEKKREAVARKMDGYRALGACLERIDGPLVAGMDANNWNRRTELEWLKPPEDTDPFYLQDLFFSSRPQHRLRDSLLLYLFDNPAEHEELVRLRPEGPLYITHNRGGHGPPDRFDYLMISDDFTVSEMTHDFDGARDAGSDHGVVSAVLRWDATE